MRRVVIGALALSALAPLPLAAHGASPDVMHGGCGFEVHRMQTVTGDAWVGALVERSVTTTGDAAPTPIGATVTCWLTSNNELIPGTKHSYGDLAGVPGVQAGVAPVSITLTEAESIGSCEVVDFADGTSSSFCYQWDFILLPPQTVLDTGNGAIGAADSVVCPPLADLGATEPVDCLPQLSPIA